MSELVSAIEGFRAESLAELADARIEEDFAELHRASELIELERLRTPRRDTAGASTSATGT